MTLITLDALITPITDGCLLALPADYSGVPMAATRALLRRSNKVKNLRLFCVPYSTLQADLLIGAGCVTCCEAAAVTLGEFGPAPRFSAAVLSGELQMLDSTCPAIHAALQASEKGVPFMPLRGLLGSDILKHRSDWRVIDDPFAATPSPIVLLPALAPDVALFHAPLADSEGNIWLGRRRELMTLAHAAKRTLVTVERVIDGSLFDSEEWAAGTLPSLYVDAVALAPNGAWPLALGNIYPADSEHLRGYAQVARTAAGFNAYLQQQILAKTSTQSTSMAGT